MINEIIVSSSYSPSPLKILFGIEDEIDFTEEESRGPRWRGELKLYVWRSIICEILFIQFFICWKLIKIIKIWKALVSLKICKMLFKLLKKSKNQPEWQEIRLLRFWLYTGSKKWSKKITDKTCCSTSCWYFVMKIHPFEVDYNDYIYLDELVEILIFYKFTSLISSIALPLQFWCSLESH